MGRDLFFAFPELIEEVMTRFGLNSDEITRWILDSSDEDGTQSPEIMLWRSSFLSQTHAVISQKYLGVKPQAVIGFSSGESNSLFAMGAWHDMGQMAADFNNKNVYAHQIGGDFNVAKKAWNLKGRKKAVWTNWGILASEKEIRKALKSEPLAHLLIINAPGNFVIGGDARACERIIDKIGKNKAYPLTYNIISHCPELSQYADEWRELHRRDTADVPGVRFYSSATCSHYHPTAEKSAQAILDMATHTLDFPRIVENAWQDGVRIFLEHGPRGRCSQWIDQILQDKDHLSVSLDKRGRSSLIQIFHAMAQLKSAGISVNYNELEKRLFSSDMIRNSKHISEDQQIPTRVYRVHPSKIELPDIPETGGSVYSFYFRSGRFRKCV